MHPSAPSGITADFFLITHAAFVVLAGLLLALPVPAAPAERRKAQ